MRARAVIWLVLALAVTGCSTTRLVRLDTGDGPLIVHTPFTEDGDGPVELVDDEFEETLVALARGVRPFANPLREARRLFGVPERSGVYLYEGRGPRLIPRTKRRTQAVRVSWKSTRMTN